jgi:hypothetical protein
MRSKTFFALALVCVVYAACSSDGGSVLTVRATGTVAGLAFIDRDGNAVLDVNVDAPLGGLGLALLIPGARDTIARTTTRTDGIFELPNVPVGRYVIVADGASASDSLSITTFGGEFTIVAADTTVVTIVASYPTVSPAQARLLPPGRRVFVTGIALSTWTSFADSTLHIGSGERAIRATRVRATPATAGDSVRVLGTTAVREGQPSIVDGTAFVVGPARLPAAQHLSTARAATADGGVLDAAQVEIRNAAILTGILNSAGDLLLTVNDGSGPLEVRIDRTSGIPIDPYVPGAVLNATGVLVPAPAGGRWRLRPRAERDLSVAFPVVTVAQARALPAGKRVTVEAVALNGWASFSDSSLHIADATGALRAVRVRAVSAFAGDSVRLIGTLGFQGGQPVLFDVLPFVLGQSAQPAPQAASTLLASRADGARLDAALVRVANALVSDTATVASGFRLTVNDGSGPLQVLLDPGAGFTRGLYLPGNTLDVTGVLVPAESGAAWQLKPRSRSDVSAR